MKLLFAILLVSLVTVTTIAQQTAPAPWIKDSERAQYEALSRSGREALYNFDYDKALQDFREINRLHPTHPAGPQLLAARLWAKTLYESRRLQASLYSSETFYATGDDKVDPKVIDEFRTLTRDAKRRADVRLKLVPKDIEALYWLGSIEGLKASFAEAVERRHIAALRAGNDAVDHHREVLKLDPTQLDANLTIGLYEYVVGSLPLPIKLIAGVTGFRGSKKKGLTLLERVVKEGSWARDDAAALLIVLYTREKRYQDALVLTRQLAEKYPRNYLVRLEAAGLLVAHAEQERKAKRFDAAAKAEKEAFAVFDQMLEDRALRATMSRVLDLVHFKYGEALLTAGEGERAAKEFLAATKAPHAEARLVTMAHLYTARALDLAGKRNEALSQYKQVLTRPDIYSAHDAAKKGLREPYRNELVSNGQ